MKNQEWKNNWAGRTFKCLHTEETFTIPDDVRNGQVFNIGKCMPDVGDGYYYRITGNLLDITHAMRGEDE